MNKQFRLAIVSIVSLSLFGACGDKKKDVVVEEVTVVERVSTQDVPADVTVRDAKELMEERTVLVEEMAS